MEEGLWLCRVRLRYTSHMVLKYSLGEWWQYCPPGFVGSVEGWVGVNFEFDPIEHIKGT